MTSPKNPVHTEQIVKDITGSTLCSYQIAQKYKITKMTVDRIARTHLGDSLYQKKEEMALEHLKAEFLKLKSQGMSLNNIGEKLCISKSCAYKFGQAFENQINTSEVIQIESLAPLEALPPVASVPDTTDEKDICIMPPGQNFPVSEGKFHQTKSQQKKEFSVIRIKGLQISFDASATGIDEVIAKVLKALQ